MSQSTESNAQIVDNSTIVSAQWQGPIPPPSVLKEFNAVFIISPALRSKFMANAIRSSSNNHEA